MAATDAKARLKQAVKRAAMTTGRPAPPDSTRILTYHSVGERDHEMNVTREAFAEQMAWLADNGRVITLAQAAQGIPGVAITFDDGYLDNLTNAAPILAQHNMPATVFLVTQRMGSHLDHDSCSPSLKGRGLGGGCGYPDHCRLLTWDDARQLQHLGWTIGGHTQTHARLATLPETDQRDEIANCMSDLREHLRAQKSPPALSSQPKGTPQKPPLTVIPEVVVGNLVPRKTIAFANNLCQSTDPGFPCDQIPDNHLGNDSGQDGFRMNAMNSSTPPLGHAEFPFAYPYGSALDFTPTTQRLVREAGFASAVSNRYGVVNPAEAWSLRRIWIDRTDTLETFRAKVDGRLDALRILDTAPAIRVRRALNSFLPSA